MMCGSIKDWPHLMKQAYERVLPPTSPSPYPTTTNTQHTATSPPGPTSNSATPSATTDFFRQTSPT